MMIWSRTIDLSVEWDKTNHYEMMTSDFALVVARKLEALPDHGVPRIDEAKRELVALFKDFVTDEGQDDDDLDRLIIDLYDWGDGSLDGKVNGKKVCLIKHK